MTSKHSFNIRSTTDNLKKLLFLKETTCRLLKESLNFNIQKREEDTYYFSSSLLDIFSASSSKNLVAFLSTEGVIRFYNNDDQIGVSLKLRYTLFLIIYTIFILPIALAVGYYESLWVFVPLFIIPFFVLKAIGAYLVKDVINRSIKHSKLMFYHDRYEREGS